MADVNQITDPDALAILQSANGSQAAPAPAMTDPDAMAILKSAQSSNAVAPAAASPNADAATLTANRSAAINDALGGSPLGLTSQAINYLGGVVDRHTDPDSLLRRASDAVVSNVIGAPVAAVHHGENIPVGLGQLAAHGISGITGNPAADNAVDQFERDREATYQAGTPTDVGSVAGAAAGDIAPLLFGGEASAATKLQQGADYLTQFAKSAPKLQRVLSGVLQGGTYGALNPVVNTGAGDPSFIQQKLEQTGLGAAIGGAVPVLGQIGQGAYGLVKPIVNPMGVVRDDFLANLLGDKVPQVAANLRNAPSYVPGSLPTSAQVGGVPELIQAEKALANQSPGFKTALMNRQLGNNAARLDTIGQVAGTPADLDAAVQARRATVQPQIDSLLTNGNPVNVQPILDQIQKVQDGPLGVRPTIRGALSDLHQVISSRAQNGTMAPDVLDAIRQNANDYLRQHAPNGVVGTQEGVALGPIKDQIVSSIDGSNPGYSNYLSDYARLSQPITDQRSASGILDNLGSVAAGADQRPLVTLNRYSSALKKASNGPYPLSDPAQTALNGVQNDLQRETVSNSVRSPGSDTAYNLSAPGWLASKMYGNQFQGGGLPAKLVGGALGSVLGGGIGGGLAGYLGLEKIGNLANSRVFNAAQKLMLNPQDMAAELDKLSAKNPTLGKLLGRYVQQQAAYNAPQAMQTTP